MGKRTLLSSLLLGLLSACGGDGEEGPQGPLGPVGPIGPSTSVDVDPVAAGETCPAGGFEVRVGDADPIVLCNGVDGDRGQTGDRGPEGEDGTTPEVDVTTIEPDPEGECGEAGGLRVEIIVAGATVADEVICNGLDGEDGERGEDGEDGERGEDGLTPEITVSTIDGAEDGVCGLAGGHEIQIVVGTSTDTVQVCNGAEGPQGPTGPQGPIGPEGASALTVSPLDPDHANCPAGGLQLDLLDGEGEPLNTYFLCNGEAGPTGPIGPAPTVHVAPADAAACPDGGSVITLGGAEPFTLCNGADGATPDLSVVPIGPGDEGCDDGGFVLIVNPGANEERYPLCVGTPAGAICGNDVAEADEVCDGTDLAGATCESLGFDEGTLACAANCDAFDTSDCRYTATTVVINEVTSAGSDDVEFLNVGSTPVDMSGWQFTDDELERENIYIFPQGTILAPGDYLVIRNPDDFAFGLGGTDEANLFDPEGNFIDGTGWQAGQAVDSWCRLPDGTGPFRSCARSFGEDNTAANPDFLIFEDCTLTAPTGSQSAAVDDAFTATVSVTIPGVTGTSGTLTSDLRVELAIGARGTTPSASWDFFDADTTENAGLATTFSTTVTLLSAGSFDVVFRISDDAGANSFYCTTEGFTERFDYTSDDALSLDVSSTPITFEPIVTFLQGPATIEAETGTGTLTYSGTATPTFAQGTTGPGSNGWNITQWPATDFDPSGPYVELTASATDVDALSFRFDARRSGQGPTAVTVRAAGADGVFSTVGTLAPPDSEWITENTYNLNAFAGEATVSVRVYGHNASGGSGTLRLFDLRLLGGTF